MIRIELDDGALSRIRIAISPLWETCCSMLLLERQWHALEFPYARWGETARAAITGPAAFAYEIVSRGAYSPDFLCPAPITPAPSIEDELAAVRATPPEVMERELAEIGIPDYYRFTEPGEIDRYVDGIEAYWHRAIRPFWPEMRAALEQEVLFRAKSLARLGPSGLLADLHRRVRWEPPILMLEKSDEYAFSADQRSLLLIPLIFSRGALMCGTQSPHSISVSYQARGAIVLADRNARPDALAAADVSGVPDGLAMLLGRGRAQVLRGLGTPSTTAGLAAMLGLAPSTVSEHLTVLVNAGVAHRHRAGRQVVYGLEPAGRAMVALIAPDA